MPLKTPRRHCRADSTSAASNSQGRKELLSFLREEGKKRKARMDLRNSSKRFEKLESEETRNPLTNTRVKSVKINQESRLVKAREKKCAERMEQYSASRKAPGLNRGIAIDKSGVVCGVEACQRVNATLKTYNPIKRTQPDSQDRIEGTKSERRVSKTPRENEYCKLKHHITKIETDKISAEKSWTPAKTTREESLKPTRTNYWHDDYSKTELNQNNNHTPAPKNSVAVSRENQYNRQPTEKTPKKITKRRRSRKRRVVDPRKILREFQFNNHQYNKGQNQQNKMLRISQLSEKIELNPEDEKIQVIDEVDGDDLDFSSDSIKQLPVEPIKPEHKNTSKMRKKSSVTQLRRIPTKKRFTGKGRSLKPLVNSSLEFSKDGSTSRSRLDDNSVIARDSRSFYNPKPKALTLRTDDIVKIEEDSQQSITANTTDIKSFVDFQTNCSRRDDGSSIINLEMRKKLSRLFEKKFARRSRHRLCEENEGGGSVKNARIGGGVGTASLAYLKSNY